ncbi:hypothetical protein [Paeniglutamicibacter kerguelensis]|uniref:Lysyl-tRNA synthetase n=1 Tax=Paeniglutamicibacter kerguelensis TaxID=254788 RepID=A0ABS4XK75_9MICC|nr:hypothetical protein [Paeniglutamicibacter kerguelensis]MBP2388873.1 hypothetical protein [Paeniglutamicibacter kerguelensis]
MPYIEALLPTVVVALIFWFVIRAVSNVDRTERLAEAEVDEQMKSNLGETGKNSSQSEN